MDKEVFKDLTYGMFVVSTNFKGKNVGCFVNTVVQITSSSMLFAVSVNKDNYTNKAIRSSKKFAISVLSEKSNPEVIGKFGFLCSKDVDKFADFEVLNVQNLPVVSENICGYLICELVNIVDADSHDVFIAKAVDAKKVNNFSPMTYAYYHKVIKGKAPKTAPTFVEENLSNKQANKKEDSTKKPKGKPKKNDSAKQSQLQNKAIKTKVIAQNQDYKKYRCTICGHIYDEEKEGVRFADLPKNWTCPICCVGKELFEEIK